MFASIVLPVLHCLQVVQKPACIVLFFRLLLCDSSQVAFPGCWGVPVL